MSNNRKSEQWLTVPEAAQRLGLSESTVRLWVRRGWLEAVSRISGHGVRISLASVRAAEQPVVVSRRGGVACK